VPSPLAARRSPLANGNDKGNEDCIEQIAKFFTAIDAAGARSIRAKSTHMTAPTAGAPMFEMISMRAKKLATSRKPIT
jgi:hypothetical protein